MTETPTADATDDGEQAHGPPASDGALSPGSPGRWLVLVGTPVLLGGLFAIHPAGSHDLAGMLPIADTWLLLHLAMLPLLGALGVAVSLLLAADGGSVATLGRAGVVVYMSFYLPFEAILGIAQGLLAHVAHGLPAAQQEGIAVAVETLAVPAMALGVIGSVGLLVAVVAIGAQWRRAGAPLTPLLLLGGAPVAAVFHAGTPLDALGMAAFLAGVVWLESGWRWEADAAAAQDRSPATHQFDTDHGT